MVQPLAAGDSAQLKRQAAELRRQAAQRLRHATQMRCAAAERRREAAERKRESVRLRLEAKQRRREARQRKAGNVHLRGLRILMADYVGQGEEMCAQLHADAARRNDEVAELILRAAQAHVSVANLLAERARLDAQRAQTIDGELFIDMTALMMEHSNLAGVPAEAAHHTG
ncbi:Uncharacterized protein PBTT_04927 [Plasmodiophora brassicae]|uniref:Uncharacterized protein n=1 Tax=Plasmodiophora brassicae TaxID=37360 RepID=A0A0G4IRN7_PLABS|nr:hypothetical protein PBRA_005928 [Plasmodiophora brassicae]SPQ98360.1 unnamed protein product [Plasmodiophora brassicae]